MYKIQLVDVNFIYSLLKEPYTHYLIIFSVYILTWYKSLSGDFLIDDDQGIQKFSESWQGEVKDKDGKVTREEKVINSYKEGEKEYKFLDYLPHLGFPGAFMRWHRLHLGKKFAVVGKNKNGHDVYAFVQDPKRHHFWSLLVNGIALALCYNFLNYHFGSNIAFSATLLFSIHPIVSQAVCWISGINYVYCLTLLLANYNILQLGLSYYWTIPLTILFTSLSSLSLLVGCFNFATLWTLGYHWEAFAALLVGLAVLLKDGTTVVNYRRGEFKKQNMMATITPNVRKPIVMLKTLWYYIKLTIFPNRLGLYHEFCYHYDRKDEEPDSRFWLGLLSLIGMGLAYWYGNLMAKFCVVWFLSYFVIFSNFITANQFVVERYIFIPSLAFCVLFGSLLYPYKPLFWFLIGLYAMRSSLHVWTFNDQISFYASNTMNFPKSEVAYGNLGVAYQGKGKSGTAFDLWHEATRINPFYDVPWYNMHSLLKTSGNLEQSMEYLNKCMNAKIVHFKDTWDKEKQQLQDAIIKKKTFEALNKEMNDAINKGDSEGIKAIKQKMDMLMNPPPPPPTVNP